MIYPRQKKWNTISRLQSCQPSCSKACDGMQWCLLAGTPFPGEGSSRRWCPTRTLPLPLLYFSLFCEPQAACPWSHARVGPQARKKFKGCTKEQSRSCRVKKKKNNTKGRVGGKWLSLMCCILDETCMLVLLKINKQIKYSRFASHLACLW